jgi:DNA polymerase-3 subunit epsilon/ATP-dependent DNA helicase DinG/DNA polymerase-3 subunit alpha (Gram-positive type)
MANVRQIRASQVVPLKATPAPARAKGAFVFFDLETTGLSPRGDRIIEIAGLHVAPGGRLTDEFHALVRINRPVPPFITSMTGITTAMLAEQETIEVNLPRFLDFADGVPLVSYNVPFDMGFLHAEAARLQLAVSNVAVCALREARRRLPRLPNHKLMTVAAHFGVAANQSHRALDDCHMGLEVFRQLMRS